MSTAARVRASASDDRGAPWRVALLASEAGLGGGELLLLEHLAQLDRSAFAPLVVTTAQGPLAQRARRAGASVHIQTLCDAPTWRGLWRPSARDLVGLLRLLRRERVQLVHAFTLASRNYAHAATLLARLPSLQMSQDTWFGERMRPLDWWALNHLPSRVIATSDTVLRSLQVGTRLDPRRTVRIYPGVDLVRFAPSADPHALRARLGLPTAVPLVGIAGRLNSSVKDFPTFFAAAARIARECPQVRFAVIGGAALPDDDAQTVREQVVGTPLEPRILWTGFRDDVAPWIAALDVLVSASRRESFGLVLAEAAACGRPVVAARSGGAEEIVVDGTTGLLVPTGDPGALARGVLALLADRARAQAMGRAGRLRAQTHFDVRQMTRAIEAEYRSALGAHGERA